MPFFVRWNRLRNAQLALTSVEVNEGKLQNHVIYLFKISFIEYILLTLRLKYKERSL